MSYAFRSELLWMTLCAVALADVNMSRAAIISARKCHAGGEASIYRPSIAPFLPTFYW